MKTNDERTYQSQLVRDSLEHQIKEAQDISDEILQERAIENATIRATVRIVNIWLGDIKTN